MAGLRLDDLGTERLTWVDLRAFVVHAPPGSALHRAMTPDPHVTLEVALLREIEHKLRVQLWQNTQEASKGDKRNYPTRLPVTEAEHAEHLLRVESADGTPEEAPSLAEVKDWLGWEKQPAQPGKG